MMQLSQNRKKGKIGEVHAAAFLKRNGYTLLDRNYAYRGGELDIIAQSSSGTLLFVEVKTVWNTKKGAPESRVNAQKKFRLWRTACHYLYTKKYPENIIEDLKAEHTVYSIDGQKIALELGNSKVLNSVVLGCAAKHIGFDKETWLETVAATVPAKTIDLNKKAFLCGYDK